MKLKDIQLSRLPLDQTVLINGGQDRKKTKGSKEETKTETLRKRKGGVNSDATDTVKNDFFRK